MVNAWFNSDKLYIKFGPDAGTATKAGSRTDPAEGSLNVIEFELTLTDLTSTQATVLFDNIIVPAKAWVEKIETHTVVAATSSGSNATLNIGLVKEADRTTEIKFDGLIAAQTVANMNAVNKLATITTVGAGTGGNQVGVAIASPGYISGYWGTEAFTAGKVKVRIFYRLDANVKGSDNT